MARPMKNGLTYFPFDVDFFTDKKIKRLRAKYGADGIAVYMYLLCEIYRSGYYIEYDEDLILDISDELNLSEGSTTQIMNYLLSRSLFDETLAKSVKVLTAASIQRRYQEAKKGSKRDISKFIAIYFWRGWPCIRPLFKNYERTQQKNLEKCCTKKQNIC